MIEALSVILEGLGLVNAVGDSKAQKQVIATLENIKEILQTQSRSINLESQLVPNRLWLTWRDAVHPRTIILVTGCHEFSEIFDRPTAYTLKLAIDQFGEYASKDIFQGLYTLVMGDIWFIQDSNFVDRPYVLSIGGPNVNQVSARIVEKGLLLHEELNWSIVKHDERYAIYGDDPKDTLAAMRAFAERELIKYLSRVWVKK